MTITIIYNTDTYVPLNSNRNVKSLRFTPIRRYHSFCNKDHLILNNNGSSDTLKIK